MLWLVQYLRGYVCIRVWGYSPERFMNLCSNHDIFLWEIENHGEYYTMCVTINGFRRLRGIVKKTGTRVAIQKRCGLPFFARRMRRRKFFLIGCIGSLVFWMWMSTFIWAVDIHGNYSVSEDVFMDFLWEQDVYVGMKQREVNIEELEKQIRRDFPIVTWTSAKIEGTRLEIQIKENEVLMEPVHKEDKPQTFPYGSDLTAEEDGTIVGMVTRAGVPQVTVGMQIKKGDVLVCGSVPVYNEDATIRKYQYYEADADIYIQRSLHLLEELPLTHEEKQYTGEERKALLLGIMSKDAELGIGGRRYEYYDKVTDKKQVKLLDNFYLPLYYGSSVNREYVLTDTIYTKEEVKKLFSEKLSKFIAGLEEKGVQIIEKDVTINRKQKAWQMNVNLQIIEKTGKSTAGTAKELQNEEKQQD